MRSDWPYIRIGELVASGDAALQTGPFGSQLHKHDYVEHGVSIIPTEAIGRGAIRPDASLPQVSEAKATELARHKLRPGDILFARRGVQATGLSAVVGREHTGALCGTGAILLRVNQEVMEPNFLAAALAADEAYEWLRAHAVGAVMPNLNSGIISQLAVPKPSLAEQRAIASTSQALRLRIDLLRQTNATLESIAQALFKSWFIDFDPVRAKAEGREPEGMEAATAALFPGEFEESALGLIPKGWSVERLGAHLSELFTGRRPKGGVAGFTEGVPSIGAESIQGIGVFDYGKTKYVPEEFYASMRSGKPNDFDILLYKDGGKPGQFMPRLGMFGCGFPFETYCINEHVFGIRCSENLGQPYGYFWIQQERILDVLRGLGNKAAIPGINRGDVEGLPILIPHRRLVEAFSVATLPLIKRILGNSAQAFQLGELRDALLPRLISGKLRLPEAQAQLEESLA